VKAEEGELIIIDIILSKAREQGKARLFHKDSVLTNTGEGRVGLYDYRSKGFKVAYSLTYCTITMD
jgi:hypothetical protein